MRLPDLLKTATRDVNVNRKRSLLTMLGIIIGVAAVVLMTGIGKSMESVILGQISALGPQTIAIWPGKQGPEGGSASMRADFDSLTLRDIDALRKLTSIRDVAPLMFIPGSAVYGREKMEPRTVGATPEYYLSQEIDVTAGRFHDESDERGTKAVAVIGSDVAADLFPAADPVGKRIQIGGKSFTIIGVLKPVGTQFFQNLDDRIIVPFSVAHVITGHEYVDMVTAQIVGDKDSAFEEVESLLRRRHGVPPPGEGEPQTENDDFLVRSAEQAQSILGAVSLALTLFITMIAGISLVVGGIGIMNIMLVAVTERTREIGLRKALGARSRDILFQFLVEAVFLTMFGGVVGIILGIGGDALVAGIAGRYLAEYGFAVSPGSILVAFLMAALTGVTFGITPARRAARLNPIDALRYE